MADFPNANNGYQTKISVVDQNGNVVQINGVNSIMQSLRINSTGTVNYLGLATTNVNWTQTYGSNPGTTTYTVTVALLGSSGNPVPNVNAAGTPSGGNVQQQFATCSYDLRAELRVDFHHEADRTNQWGDADIGLRGVQQLRDRKRLQPAAKTAATGDRLLRSIHERSRAARLQRRGLKLQQLRDQHVLGPDQAIGLTATSRRRVASTSRHGLYPTGGTGFAHFNAPGLTPFAYSVGVFSGFFVSTATQQDVYDAIVAFAPTVGF